MTLYQKEYSFLKQKQINTQLTETFYFIFCCLSLYFDIYLFLYFSFYDFFLALFFYVFLPVELESLNFVR